jgi:dTDP-4-amino-4,6-dideoxygalactose transaminase
MINVTKTFLPPFDEYISILKRAWDKAWITNNGELLMELEEKLKSYLNVDHLLYCSNGTIVLQMALKMLGITKEVITTPFSYVATTNAILWEGCKPVFVDIDPDTFCIDANKIEAAITEDTEAILATHVYGIPCNVEKIESIARQHKIKVIYDAAHAFGCIYRGKSLLNYGDISTCSFHATKVFHTVEGGALIAKDPELHKKGDLYRSFGHKYDDYFCVGINGKNSEFHAAMGLTILPKMSEIISERKKVFKMYEALLPSHLRRPVYDIEDFSYNFSYYPVVFNSEDEMLCVRKKLEEKEIYTRRYFYPSLNLLPQVTDYYSGSCPISENISLSVLSLPVYPGLKEQEVELICSTIKTAL